jgi:MFS family permease
MRPGGEPRPFAILPRNLAPFGFRNYLLYWIGFAVTNTGKNIELTGAVWLASQLDPSPILLGLLGIARAAPALLFGPISGVVADRFDQRKLLFVTQGLGLLASAALGIRVMTGTVQLWEIYLQVAIQASIMSFDASTRQALFPQFVPREQLGEAVTLTTTATRLSAFVGPAIGGLSIAAFGVASPFLLNAATFPVLMAAVVWIRGLVRSVPEAASTFRGEFSEGLRHLTSAPVLLGLIKMEIVFGIFQVNSVMVTIVARDILHVGPEGLGGLLSADALGGLIGLSLLLTFGHTRRQGRFNLLCTLAYAGALVVFGLSQSYVLSFIALGVTGAMDVLIAVTRNHILQLATPPRLRGRVMGNLGTITRGMGPLAQTQNGLLTGIIGGPLAVLAAAGALAVNAVLTARTNRLLWDFSRDEERLPEAIAIEPILEPPDP